MLILHYHEFIGRLKNMKKKIFDGCRLYARALIGIDDKLRDEVNLKKCFNINYVSYKRL